jgi:hypothetical protein
MKFILIKFISFGTLQMLQNHNGRGEPEIEVRMQYSKYEHILSEDYNLL